MVNGNNTARAHEMATYNLKAVVQQTGVKPDTLRAWERRYGLPQPERTAGGHRIYSEEDIEILLWLLSKQAEGLSISRAVKLWHDLIDKGENPLAHKSANLNDAVTKTAVVQTTDQAATIKMLRSAWITACMEFNERQAEAILTQAFSYYPAEVVVIDVLQKGLAEIGNNWYTGKITVQQEHFASALAIRRLDALLAGTPPPTRPERIITACAPEDDHTFSPLLLTLLLRRQGFDVVYLGSRVPTERLAATINKTKPDLVIFSAQLLYSAASLLEVAEIVAKQGTQLAFGGLIFNLIPAICNRIPGHFLGKRLDLAPQLVNSLLKFPRSPAPTADLPETFQMALKDFRGCAATVEAEVWSASISFGLQQGALGVANQTMTRNIVSALMLGDLNYIGSDIHWVEGLLANYRLPSAHLYKFLCNYAAALNNNLDPKEGKIVLDWFAGIIDSMNQLGVENVQH